MNMTIAQKETNVQDAIARIMKGKTVVADEETWRSIRFGVIDRIDNWGDQHSEYIVYGWTEVNRLDQMYGIDTQNND